MPRHDRLKIARFAVDSIAPFVRASGQRHLPQPNMPGHWLLVWQGLQPAVVNFKAGHWMAVVERLGTRD